MFARNLHEYNVRFSECIAIQFVRVVWQDKILIGHDIKNDLRVLQLRHPPALIRDTLTHPWIMHKFERRNLQTLAKELLGLYNAC